MAVTRYMDAPQELTDVYVQRRLPKLAETSHLNVIGLRSRWRGEAPLGREGVDRVEVLRQGARRCGHTSVISAQPHSSGTDKTSTRVQFLLIATWRVIVIPFRYICHLFIVTATTKESVPVIALTSAQSAAGANTLNACRMGGVKR